MYQGDRDRLGLAIRRLGGLPSRIGRFGTEGRVLDTAIALETMYSLDASEITYKLETRAGYLLGTNGEERMKIFGKVKNFYNARSALVHGSRGKPETGFGSSFPFRMILRRPGRSVTSISPLGNQAMDHG